MTSMSMSSGHCLPSSLEACSEYIEEEDEEEGIVREYQDSTSRSERSEEELEEGRVVDKRLLSDSGHCSSKKRRKQSNPVKVFAGENKLNGQTSVNSRAAMNERRTELRCPYCSQVFCSEDSFGYHIKIHHVRALISAGDSDRDKNAYHDTPLNLSHQKMSGANCDRHSNGSTPDSDELLDNGGAPHVRSPDKSPPLNSVPFAPPAFLLPFISQAASQEAQNTLAGLQEPGVKIFNPEAYCELCNKEFCNKYFLKTHKANKHGVYSDLPSMGTVSTMSFNSGICQDNSQSAQSQPVLSSINHSPSVDSHDLIRFPREPDRVSPTNKTVTRQLCQKVFGDSCALVQQRNNEQSEQPLDASHMSLNLSKHSNYVDLSSEAASSSTKLNGNSSLDTEAVESSKSAEKSIMSSDSGARPDSFNEKYDDTSTDLCSTPKVFTKEQMSQMGVINPEAFCTICCKEFCNKYFLKVHKFRRHSIGSPPQERSNINIQQDGNISCLPLEKLLEAPVKEVVNSLECEACGRSFQNGYLLQMHKYYFHNFDQTGISSSTISPSESQQQRIFSDENNHTGEHFSQDLQKLQGMISGLKDKKEGGYKCHICGRLAENPYLLQVHLLKDHGMFGGRGEKLNLFAVNMQNGNQTPKPTESSVAVESSSQNAQTSETVCIICKKECYAPFFLQQHLINVHGLQGQPLSETAFLARIRHEVDNQKKPDRPKPASTSRSYCEICNKELCNKYFMKTHMIKMHGINMDNHQTQGVKCDICQKEICSAYFLKVHKQNTHGIYDPEDDRALKENGVPKDEEGLEICGVCSGKFKTAKLLECHMQSEHGATKEKKTKCGINSSQQQTTTPTVTSCTFCGLSFPDILTLRLHVIQAHPPKQDDSVTTNEEVAQNGGNKVVLNPFGSFTPPFSPFIRPERMLNLLPRIGSSALLDQTSRSGTAPRFPGLDLQQSLLSQQLSLPNSLQTPKQKDLETSRRSSSEQKDCATKMSALEAALKKPASNKRYFCCRICRRRFLHRVAFLYHWHEKHIMHSFKQARSVGGFYKKQYRCRSCSFSSRRRLTMRKHIYRRHHRSAPLPRVTSTPIVATNSAADSFHMQSFILSMPESPMPGDACLVPAHVTLPVSSRLTQKTRVSIHLMPA